MKKTIIKIITMPLLGLFLGANAQATNTGTMELNAIVDAGCFLTANNINFGSLQMPLINQSASSEMSVKCSNNAPYQIKIGYGDTVTGSSDTYTYTVTGSNYHLVKLYKDNVPISRETFDFNCDSNNPGVVIFYSEQAAQLYGYNSSGSRKV